MKIKKYLSYFLPLWILLLPAVGTMRDVEEVKTDHVADHFIKLKGTAGDWLSIPPSVAAGSGYHVQEYWQNLTEAQPDSYFLHEQAFLFSLYFSSFEDIISYGSRSKDLGKDQLIDRKALEDRKDLIQYYKALKTLKEGGSEDQVIAHLEQPLSGAFSFAYQALRFRMGNDSLKLRVIKNMEKDFKALSQYLALEYAYEKSDAKKIVNILYESPDLYFLTGPYNLYKYLQLLKDRKMDEDAKYIYQEWKDRGMLRNIIDVDKAQHFYHGSKAEALASDLSFIGVAFMTQKSLPLTNIYMNMAHQLDPKNDVIHLQRISGYLRRGMEDNEALRELEVFSEDSLVKERALFESALIYSRKKDFDKALETIQQLYQGRSDQIEYLLLYGEILAERKDYLGCAEYMDKAIELAEIQAISDREQGRYYFTRGSCYERAKIWEKAEADLLKSIELSPENPTALNYLAYSWADMGIHLDEAEEMILKAIEKFPNSGGILDSLGWVYFRQNRLEEALDVLDQAASLAPSQGEIYDHLGDVLWYLGRRHEAAYAWQRVIDMGAEDQVLERAKYKRKTLKPIEVPGEMRITLQDVLEENKLDLSGPMLSDTHEQAEQIIDSL